jgi:hypothetical protein
VGGGLGEDESGQARRWLVLLESGDASPVVLRCAAQALLRRCKADGSKRRRQKERERARFRVQSILPTVYRLRSCSCVIAVLFYYVPFERATEISNLFKKLPTNDVCNAPLLVKWDPPNAPLALPSLQPRLPSSRKPTRNRDPTTIPKPLPSNVQMTMRISTDSFFDSPWTGFGVERGRGARVGEERAKEEVLGYGKLGEDFRVIHLLHPAVQLLPRLHLEVGNRQWVALAEIGRNLRRKCRRASENAIEVTLF